MKKSRTKSIKKILNKIKEYRSKERNTLRKREGIGQSSRTYFHNLQVDVYSAHKIKNSPWLCVLYVCGYEN
jgi:histone deacetylase complex regulatory component SIN3